MFSAKDFRKLILSLTLLLFLHIPILFIIYNDVVYAFATTVITGGMGLLFGIVYEYAFGIGRRFRIISENDIQSGILPLNKLFSGLFFPLAPFWVTIFGQYELIGNSWFWSMAVAIYTSWILGFTIVRYRVICKSNYVRERYEEIKSRTISNDKQEEESGKDDIS